MSRRDAFSTFRSPTSAVSTEGIDVPHQPLDLIPTAQPRKKRSRNWEQIHRSETVTYRGVPNEYHQFLGEIANCLSVPRDEVVRAFLEHGISQYREGQLRILAHPKAQRMTLFPDGERSIQSAFTRDRENHEWLAQVFPAPTNIGSRKRKRDVLAQDASKRWKTRVTYRLPVALKNEIKAIAIEHTLPVGEVVWFFIEHGILDYRSGILALQPTPKMVGKTLFQE